MESIIINKKEHKVSKIVKEHIEFLELQVKARDLSNDKTIEDVDSILSEAILKINQASSLLYENNRQRL